MCPAPTPDPIRDAELEQLVFECLERIDAEGDQALADLCAAHPEHARNLRAQIEALRRTGLVGEASAAREIPERLGDFELVERLGGGGMGVVYRARQISLAREVALKLIRPENLWFEGARERFRREVEAIARLQHPGIVPVYTVGEERGVPYFAMELVRGSSLGDVLDALRGRKFADLGAADFLARIEGVGAAPIFDGTWWECVARIVRDVADSLEHAHRRGVLHRDLKPSNVMVTREGRVLLLDFGLAAREGADRLTRTGSQLGSLPYLSPEQVEGGAAAIDARSDVYALGVTLYEMLTGELPFRADGVPALLRRIADGRPIPPRKLNPALPPDLDVVCRTAIERDVGRRYASAADFARDLGHVLERRPIDARAAGPVERVSRWAARRPAQATASALAATILFGGPTALWLTQREANARTLGALEQVREQRDRAQKSLDLAGRSIENLLGRVGHESLRRVPRVEAIRRQLLQDALAFSEELARVDPNEEAALERSSRALVRLAHIEVQLKQVAPALDHADRAIAALARIEGDEAAELTSAALVARARALRALGRNEEALTAAANASATALRVAHPLDVDARRRHRVSLESLRAELLLTLGRADEALALQRATILEQREVVARDGSDEDRLLLGDLLTTLGFALGESGAIEDSAAALAEAIEIVEDCLTRDPVSPDLRASIAAARMNHGTVLARGGRLDESTPHLRRAIELFEGLVRDFPDTVEHQVELDSCRQSLGGILAQMPDGRAEAETVLREAVSSLEKLCATRADDARCRSRLSMAVGNLGGFLAPTDPARALELFERAVVELEPIRAAEPRNAAWSKQNGEWLAWIAFMHVKQGRIAAAVTKLAESCEFLPREWRSLRGVAGRWGAFGRLAQRAQDLPEAERAHLHDECVRRGLDALRAALDAGYRDFEDLRSSRELDGLRDSPEWPAIERSAADLAAGG